jgi:glycosyltransferase involved in cell wall biosynthesis
MNNPLFSIVIPVYNVEKYLHECVNSVLNQNFRDYEIILVDDGSPDNCPVICDKYAEKFSHVKVIHKINGGLSDARNIGIQNATGEWIFFLDSDDKLFNDNVLNNLSETIKKSSEPIIFCPYTVFFTNNTIICKSTFSKDIYICTPVSLYKQCAKTKTELCACVFILKRNFLLKNNLFFTLNMLHEDMEWIPRVLLLVNTIHIHHKPCYLYRRDNISSITSHYSEKRFSDAIAIIKTYHDKLNDASLIKRDKIFLSYWITLIFFLLIGDLSELIVSDKILYNKCKKELFIYKTLLLYRCTFRNILLYLSLNVFHMDITIYIFTVIKKMGIYIKNV